LKFDALVLINGMSRSSEGGADCSHEKASAPSHRGSTRKRSKVELTIGIDLGDVWSHYCTFNQQGEAIDRGRFRTTPKAIDKWFIDVPHASVAMEAGVHSIWISEQLEQLGHEVIVANVRELRAISHSDRKSDDVDGRSWLVTLVSTLRLCGRSLIAPSSSKKPSP
jgi:hypothetical protein